MLSDVPGWGVGWELGPWKCGESWGVAEIGSAVAVMTAVAIPVIKKAVTIKAATKIPGLTKRCFWGGGSSIFLRLPRGGRSLRHSTVLTLFPYPKSDRS